MHAFGRHLGRLRAVGLRDASPRDADLSGDRTA
jgi:hypothetical protein